MSTYACVERGLRFFGWRALSLLETTGSAVTGRGTVTSGTDFAFLDFPGVLVASSMFDLATCC